jgi:hypothetical protein
MSERGSYYDETQATLKELGDRAVSANDLPLALALATLRSSRALGTDRELAELMHVTNLGRLDRALGAGK